MWYTHSTMFAVSLSVGSSLPGSCISAGYTTCCSSDDDVGLCAGDTGSCFCDPSCRDFNDCCYDLDEICPREGTSIGIVCVACRLAASTCQRDGRLCDKSCIYIYMPSLHGVPLCSQSYRCGTFIITVCSCSECERVSHNKEICCCTCMALNLAVDVCALKLCSKTYTTVICQMMLTTVSCPCLLYTSDAADE